MIVRRAIFLGSKSFGLTILRTLVESDPAVQWSVLHPRDDHDPRSMIGDFEDLCAKHSVAFQLATASEANAAIQTSNADVVLVCGWYRLLPRAVLDSGPTFLGIHNSLLPQYRGGAPLVWAILNGDAIVGSSLFALGEGMDDGDIYLQVRTNIGPADGIAQALAGIEAEYVRQLPEFWSSFVAGDTVARPQDHSRATYCAQRRPADGSIDWSQPAWRVRNFIRAQSHPYPGAFSRIGQDEVRIWRCEIDPRPWLGSPGQLLERGRDYAVIACGESSAIVVREAQLNGDREVGQIFNSLGIRLGSGSGRA